MTQQDMAVEVTTEDIQSVMRTNPMVTLQVQNQALMRKLNEAQNEIVGLRQELEQSRNGEVAKVANAYDSEGGLKED